MKFIDSFRFMSSSLSNLVDNISDRFHNSKYKDCKSCLEYNSIEYNSVEYIKAKDKHLIISKCLECKKNQKKKCFNKDLIERFTNTYKFCNEDINKFF